ncbi:MAG: hypothetical protein IPH51_08240 [Rubrivivax sp.]|nr:hypothetical protein [Rubrivivax sp.]
MKSRLYKAQAPSELSGQRVMNCDDAMSGWFILRLPAAERDAGKRCCFAVDAASVALPRRVSLREGYGSNPASTADTRFALTQHVAHWRMGRRLPSCGA